jgi:L-fuconolactonase
MNRIDSHQHFWIFDPIRDSWIDDSMKIIQKDFLPEDLKPLLLENKFAGCVAVQASQSEQETDFLLDLAAKNEFIKGIVGWVDLRADSVSERLSHYSQYKKLKGFRHVVQGEADDFMFGTAFRKGIAALKNFDFTYDILIFQHQLPAAIDLVKSFPEQKFVIDHIAKPNIKSGEVASWKKGIEEISKFENVWCKISGMVTEADWNNWGTSDLKPYFDVVFENFPTARIMFGSDWPVCNVAATYSQLVGVLENYMSSFTAADQDRVWFGNAKAFYKL